MCSTASLRFGPWRTESVSTTLSGSSGTRPASCLSWSLQNGYRSWTLLRESDKKLFYDNYLPLSLEPVGPDYERVEISEVDSRSFLGDYALRSPGESLTTAKERELFAAFVDTIVKNRSDVERRSLLQASHVSKLLESMKQGVVLMLNPKASRWDIEDMTALIKETGYTPLDVQDDHIANDLDPPKPKVEVFAISIEYRLDGRDLVVTVPLDEIQYPADVLDASGNHVSCPLHSVSLLDYFGAADQSRRSLCPTAQER